MHLFSCSLQSRLCPWIWKKGSQESYVVAEEEHKANRLQPLLHLWDGRDIVSLKPSFTSLHKVCWSSCRRGGKNLHCFWNLPYASGKLTWEVLYWVGGGRLCGATEWEINWLDSSSGEGQGENKNMSWKHLELESCPVQKDKIWPYSWLYIQTFCNRRLTPNKF